MKILFYGDSITDAGRERNNDASTLSLGGGYVRDVASFLYAESPVKHQIINRGISGNRVVDLYSRIKADCWNLQPDLISILIGVNDVWHEINHQNGVEIERFEKVYRMLIEDTLARLPSVKIVLCEPFVLEGSATVENYQRFLEVKNYAKVVEKLAKEYGLYFLPLQEKLDEGAKAHGEQVYLRDGVHPAFAGASLIAQEWLKLFKNQIEK